MSKWTYESPGIFYPCGDFKLYPTPGSGVFNLVKSPNPMDGRIGLEKIADRFEFPFKIYDLGINDFIQKVKHTWNSEIFEKSGQNLGIILNGVKGTGKTIGAKILCNEINIPVINISYPIPGMLEFIQSLEFECVVLLDEAEKTFPSGDLNSSQLLLKMIDGVMNKSRKLYILTTNTLDINDNLKGRPGRIRYIQNFRNITPKAVDEYLADNLVRKEAIESIYDLLNSLEVSTIDTLKSIVDEANVYGTVSDSSNLNLTMSSNSVEVLYYDFGNGSYSLDAKERRFNAAKEFLRRHAWRDRPVYWAFTTKFNKEFDPEWDWDNPSYEWEENEELKAYQEVMASNAAKRIIDLNLPCSEEGNNGSQSNLPVTHYMSEYLAGKFNVVSGYTRVLGSKLRVGSVTREFGEIYKEEDGWFYSRRGGGQEIRILPQYSVNNTRTAVYG